MIETPNKKPSNEPLNIKKQGVIFYITAFLEKDGKEAIENCSSFYIHRYIHTYIRTYIHTYIDTYIHTYIHIHRFPIANRQ